MSYIIFSSLTESFKSRFRSLLFVLKLIFFEPVVVDVVVEKSSTAKQFVFSAVPANAAAAAAAAARGVVVTMMVMVMVTTRARTPGAQTQ